MPGPEEYVVPELNKSKFHCPHCSVCAEQRWHQTLYTESAGSEPKDVPGLRISSCTHCEQYSVWFWDRMVAPPITSAPSAHPDMPEDLTEYYEEASTVLHYWPRSSAALLRLAIRRLCIQLGLGGEKLENDIDENFQAALSTSLRRSLIDLRVIGKDRVYPGTLDARDDAITASALFALLNLMVENGSAIRQHSPQRAHSHHRRRTVSTK